MSTSPSGEPRKLADLMQHYLGPKGLGKERRRLEELRRAWIEAAGTEVAEQTRVRSLRRGVLSIEVQSGPLAFELAGFRRAELLEKVREHAPDQEIAALHFRQG